MKEDYYKAHKKAKRTYQKAIMEGKYPFVPALDDILGDIGRLPEQPVGVMDIPLYRVAGTKTRGRQEAFASNFMPLLDFGSEFSLKWSSLYDAQIEEGIHDAVSVYEFMWKFYVLEGNKRVSVLKYLDVPTITADITRILPPRNEDPNISIYYEFLDFFKVAPIYDICFSQEGSYQKLASLLGQNLTDPWSDDLIGALKYSFSTFSDVYWERGGGRFSMTEADAFLVYLGIYRYEGFGVDDKKTVQTKIEKIWNEFLLESTEDNIDFQEVPEVKKKESIIPSILKKSPAYTEAHPLKIGFIYDRPAADSSWIYGHELGRNQLMDCFPGIVRTKAFEDCGTEDKFNEAVETASEDGCQLIFTAMPMQMDDTLRAAIRYPHIRFMNCSVNLSHNAVRTYYGRMFEAKFLMGALAASTADNHKIGYVAAYPIFGTISNINAFAIGAAMFDPDVKIHLAWSSQMDVDWHNIMKEEDIRVISGPDFIRPQQATREHGLFQINQYGNIVNLASPVWDWGKYYERIVETILDDTLIEESPVRKDQALNYWWGMNAGVIDVILSQHIPYYSRKMVHALKSALMSGSVHPFGGELRSQTGIIKGEGTARLSNEEIIEMDWLNDNVVGGLPKFESLTEPVRKAIETSGIISQQPKKVFSSPADNVEDALKSIDLSEESAAD